METEEKSGFSRNWGCKWKFLHPENSGLTSKSNKKQKKTYHISTASNWKTRINTVIRRLFDGSLRWILREKCRKEGVGISKESHNLQVSLFHISSRDMWVLHSAVFSGWTQHKWVRKDWSNYRTAKILDFLGSKTSVVKCGSVPFSNKYQRGSCFLQKTECGFGCFDVIWIGTPVKMKNCRFYVTCDCWSLLIDGLIFWRSSDSICSW